MKIAPDAKILEARITPLPLSFMDPLPQVYVKAEGDEREFFLFDYYPDELSFRAEEFVGLTVPEARALKQRKDLDYLRS